MGDKKEIEDDEKGDKYIVASWKRCMAVIQQIMAIFFNGSAMAASHWVRVDDFRSGIFEKCTYRNLTEDHIIHTLPDAPSPGECDMALDRAYIQACVGLQIVGGLCSLVGAFANIKGLSSDSSTRKFVYYRFAMYLALLGVLFQLISLCLFPIYFNMQVNELDPIEFDWARNWSFGWCYFMAWIAAINTFLAAQLIFSARNFEEIHYKELKSCD